MRAEVEGRPEQQEHRDPVSYLEARYDEIMTALATPAPERSLAQIALLTDPSSPTPPTPRRTDEAKPDRLFSATASTGSSTCTSPTGLPHPPLEEL